MAILLIQIKKNHTEIRLKCFVYPLSFYRSLYNHQEVVDRSIIGFHHL